MRLTGHKGSYINRNQRIPFVFEGKQYYGFEGDTIASALIANDELILSRSFKYHRPRSVLTMSGHDANSLVQVGEEPNARADKYEITSGLIVGGQNFYGSLKKDRARILNHFSRFLPVGFYYKTFFRPKGIWNYWDILIRNFAGLGKVDTNAKKYESDKEYKFCDVAVIGAGPAGLSAAIEAGNSGADTILIDENKLLGGSLNYARFDIDRTEVIQLRDEMINQVEQNPNITVYTNATCTGWFAENYLTVMCENKMLKIRAKHVIAATGILEQPIIFRNNDLPGVMLCSAIQRLINLYGVSPGSKVLIATTSSDGYATALDLIEAG
ncbi:MAG: 2Fe-2S iron-sulfur cluster-binding protein, partial [Pseudomonadota bacterium]